jgi:hypothetical protein
MGVHQRGQGKKKINRARSAVRARGRAPVGCVGLLCLADSQAMCKG